MSENKTSQAVSSLLSFLNDPRPTPVDGWDVGETKSFTMTNDETRAIAAKYQRMEEALQNIEDAEYEDFPKAWVREALSFDPLAE